MKVIGIFLTVSQRIETGITVRESTLTDTTQANWKFWRSVVAGAFPEAAAG
jgi:hypothetical protein